MGGLSRIIAARTFAVLLALLAASPVTAPFMTCDWTDLGHDHSAAPIHVGHHAVAAPDVKTPSDPNTTMFAVVVTVVAAADNGRERAHALPATPAREPVRAIVLRI